MKKRTTTSPVVFLLNRKNSGAIVTTSHVIKEATDTGLKVVTAFALANSQIRAEQNSLDLAPGLYLLDSNIDVIENVSGKYDYLLSIGGQGTYTDKGNVNTSPAPNESDHWADTIILHVI